MRFGSPPARVHPVDRRFLPHTAPFRVAATTGDVARRLSGAFLGVPQRRMGPRGIRCRGGIAAPRQKSLNTRSALQMPGVGCF